VGGLLAQTLERGQKYHAVECINCRKQIKVSREQLERFAPQETPAEE
jgi:hypothetical protein